MRKKGFKDNTPTLKKTHKSAIVWNKQVWAENICKKQGDFNCGASFQADFILNYFLSNFPKFSQISSNFLKPPQISSQILHFLPARLAGWNN